MKPRRLSGYRTSNRPSESRRSTLLLLDAQLQGTASLPRLAHAVWPLFTEFSFVATNHFFSLNAIATISPHVSPGGDRPSAHLDRR